MKKKKSISDKEKLLLLTFLRARYEESQSSGDKEFDRAFQKLIALVEEQ